MRKTNRFSLSLSVLSTVLRFGRELHCHECSMVCGVRYICIAQLLLYIYIRVAKTDIFVWTTSVLCPCLAFSVPIFTLRLCLFLSLTHSRSLPISLSLFLSLSPWLSVSLSLWVQRSSNVPNTRTKKRTQLYANVWVRQMPAIKSFKYFPLLHCEKCDGYLLLQSVWTFVLFAARHRTIHCVLSYPRISEKIVPAFLTEYQVVCSHRSFNGTLHAARYIGIIQGSFRTCAVDTIRIVRHGIYVYLSTK